MMITIGEFAGRCRTSRKTIRHYEQMGLILPAQVNPETGYRYYQESQIEVFLVIRRLKRYGFSLAEIKAILENRKEDNIALLERRCSQIQEDLQTQASILRELELYSHQYERTGSLMPNLMNQIQIKTLESIPVYMVRDVISMDEFDRLYGRLFTSGVQPAGPVGAIYFDEQFDRNQADTGVFMMCDPQQANTSIPAGQYVSLMHHGPYGQLPETYAALTTYIQDRALHITGAPFELYLNNPQEVPEDQLLTEVCFPVQ